MAKAKKKVNKSQLVRDMLEQDPDLSPNAIVKAMADQGHKITAPRHLVIEHLTARLGVVRCRANLPRQAVQVGHVERAGQAEGRLVVIGPALPRRQSSCVTKASSPD